MGNAWWMQSQRVTTAAIEAAERFAAKEAALDALIAAGPGSGGVFHTATEQLTHTQILALETPVVIVPATEVLGYAGTPEVMPLIVRGFAILNTPIAYGGTTDPCYLVLCYGSDYSLTGSNLAGSAGALTFVERTIFEFQGIGLQSGGANDHLVNGLPIASGTLQDNAIAIALVNAGTINGGDASATLTVTVIYIKVTTATGALVTA